MFTRISYTENNLRVSSLTRKRQQRWKSDDLTSWLPCFQTFDLDVVLLCQSWGIGVSLSVDFSLCGFNERICPIADSLKRYEGDVDNAHHMNTFSLSTDGQRISAEQVWTKRLMVYVLTIALLV